MAIFRDRKLLATTQSGAELLRPSDLDYAGAFERATGPTPQEAPPVANDDNYATTDATVLTDNLLTNDTPGDVPLAVTAVNGSALAVDREIALASGARLRVNADGSFTYNPNGAFNAIPTTSDSFTYTVAGGDTATVIVQVQDVPPAGTINGTEGPDNPINGTPGDDVINGLGGDDVINGLGGNDVIDGGTGLDAMNGGTGNDTYKVDNLADTITELDGEGYDIVIATVNYTLAAGVHVEELNAGNNGRTLTGNELDNILRGSATADTLSGGGGDDILLGGFGTDDLVGGTGDDIFYVNNGDDANEAAGEGYDIAYVVESNTLVRRFDLGTNDEVEELIADPSLGAGSTFTINGNNLNNIIRGSIFGDALNGNGGADTMYGGAGSDSYTTDGLDTIVELADEGIDTVNTSVSYSLGEGSNLENLTGISGIALSLEGNSYDNVIQGATGTDIIVGHDGNDTLKGGNANDSLYGDAGNDTLMGELGADLMDGGLGRDVYYVDNVGDSVVETEEAGQGIFTGDSIVTVVSWTLAAGQQIESLSNGGGLNLTLTGNEFDQYLSGNGAVLVNDTLIGMGGNDYMDGGGGNDTMDGGTGDDIFIVDSANDIIIERAGEGRDGIFTSVNYLLAAGVHVEALSAANLPSNPDIQLTGNELAQEIYGNNGNNIFRGGGGADTIIGYGGDDTYYVLSGTETFIEVAGQGRDIVVTGQSYVLAAGQSIEVLSVDDISATIALNLVGNELAQEIYGNNGANILRGGGGADFILGFGGDDTYYVASGAETFIETAGNGRDIVYTNQSYVLGAGQAIEVLSVDDIAATVAFNLVGNELAQEIYGNNGANILRGGGGADFILGFGGDDTYYVMSGTETFLESVGQGTRDIAYTGLSHALAAGSEVEVLSADGFGETSAINLTGNEFAQEIYGNAGANVLDGKAGMDALLGNGGADTFAFTTALGATNVDAILDFATTVDRIGLDDAIFAGIGSPGAFNANAFRAGATAGDADDRIVYNQATGQLFYDADGSGAGAQVLFATLQPGTALAVGDFSVI